MPKGQCKAFIVGTKDRSICYSLYDSGGELGNRRLVLSLAISIVLPEKT